MRRTAAATAVSLLAALAIGGPLASAGQAGTDSLQCAAAAPPAACALLDDLSAQLGPISPLLGAPLAPLTGSAQGFAAQSDQPAGVPTAEVLSVSKTLLAQLAALPEPVESLVGAAGLGGVTGTLEALVNELTAPVTGEQQSSGGSQATPAASPEGSGTPFAARSAGSGTTASQGASPSSTGSSPAPSSSAVPNVPVGDPLTLAPLALPDFGFESSFEPAVSSVPAAKVTEDLAYAEAMEELTGQDSGRTELVVVAVLSLLLLAGAGLAQVQANRHTIPD